MGTVIIEGPNVAIYSGLVTFIRAVAFVWWAIIIFALSYRYVFLNLAAEEPKKEAKTAQMTESATPEKMSAGETDDKAAVAKEGGAGDQSDQS